MEHKVIVYSTEWCPWCHKAKDWLKKNNVKFEERDPDKESKYAEEIVQKSGQTGIPVIDIDGTIIVGYNEAEMKRLLGMK